MDKHRNNLTFCLTHPPYALSHTHRASQAGICPHVICSHITLHRVNVISPHQCEHENWFTLYCTRTHTYEALEFNIHQCVYCFDGGCDIKMRKKIYIQYIYFLKQIVNNESTAVKTGQAEEEFKQRFQTEIFHPREQTQGQLCRNTDLMWLPLPA